MTVYVVVMHGDESRPGDDPPREEICGVWKDLASARDYCERFSQRLFAWEETRGDVRTGCWRGLVCEYADDAGGGWTIEGYDVIGEPPPPKSPPRPPRAGVVEYTQSPANRVPPHRRRA